MDKLIEGVTALAESEYNRASNKYGKLFNSDHQAYAVMLEEFEEAEQEARFIELRMQELWKLIKADLADSSKYSTLRALELYAINAACEFTQVAAMAKKAMLTIKDRQGE